MIADNFVIWSFKSSARSFAAQLSGLPEDLRKEVLKEFYDELEKREIFDFYYEREERDKRIVGGNPTFRAESHCSCTTLKELVGM